MCDTQIIRKNNTVFFAKNSDREPTEMQLVVRIPPIENSTTPNLRTTYLSIPETKKRFGVILSKPFWTWGAEMGVNDQGLVIGNQAVFTKVHDKTNGLIGMDLVRLALERAATVEEALFVITEHLEKYGQGGICGYQDKSFSYDNSFIIADNKNAWVLETANRHWVAKKVDKFAAISNCITIESDFDRQSKGLQDFAKKQGLYKTGEFNFAKTFSTWFLTYFSGSKQRLNTSYCTLSNLLNQTSISVIDLFNGLRTHSQTGNSHFQRSNKDVCMHACGYVRRGQTCGSLVANITNQQYFFTGTSAPCLSVFKPVNFDYTKDFGVLSLEKDWLVPTLWQKHESIHRYFLFNDEKRDEFLQTRNQVEKQMLENNKNANDLVIEWQDKWYKYVRNKPLVYPKSFYGLFWKNKTNFLENNIKHAVY
ncbi:MAG: C69 family dipeptidase [Blastocatellia bacterium]|nr:C69 family dipeptidase [Blastocatellia bacterium]